MWIALWLGCTSGPGDTGWGTPPVWSGTQIGEEGDECGFFMESVSDADPAWVARVESALNQQVRGTLTSAWQGQASATLRVQPDNGSLFLMLPADEACGGPALLVLLNMWLDAPPLLNELELSAPVLFDESGGARFEGEIYSDWTGALDPGQLPEDAGDITLYATSPGPDLGSPLTLSWRLQRTETHEESPAATFTAD